MTEAEAWRRWHREERACREFRQRLKSIELSLIGLELDLKHSLEVQKDKLVKESVLRYRKDKYFMRVLKAFHGHTPEAWKATARTDGRIAHLADKDSLGWEVLALVIKTIRKEYYYGDRQ